MGFDIALHDKSKFVDSIKHLLELNQTEFDNMSKTCVAYINEQLNVNEIKSKYIE